MPTFSAKPGSSPEKPSARSTEPAMPESTVNQHIFRNALGRFATGIAVICTTGHGIPYGFACQSFTALSLDPPLVLFCPARTSRAWAVIARTRSCTVSVLSAAQQSVSSIFGSKADGKFDSVNWFGAPESGNPVIEGCLAWLEVEIQSVIDGGDHEVAIARVQRLGGLDAADRPLLYFRGRYAQAVFSE